MPHESNRARKSTRTSTVQVGSNSRKAETSNMFNRRRVILRQYLNLQHDKQLKSRRKKLLFAVCVSVLLVGGGLVCQNASVASSSMAATFPTRPVNDYDEEALTTTCRFLDLLVLSDRENTEIPLKGLINSLLHYTTSPIHLNVVTSTPEIPWLRQLESSSPHFKVTLHSPHNLLQRSTRLVNETSLQLAHPSSAFAIQKIFLPELPFMLSSPQNKKVLMIDDDQVYFEDITPLYDYMHLAPNHVSLLCARDRFNLRKICLKQGVPHNCDDELYCVTGLVGFPIYNQTARTTLVQTLVQTTQEMMTEYPNSVASQADQDIFNRFFRSQKHSDVQNIPCEWSCGTDECGKVLGKIKCRNCETNKCKAFHYQSKSYLTNVTQMRPEVSWNYYFEKDPKELLKTTFDPRISEACNSQIV